MGTKIERSPEDAAKLAEREALLVNKQVTGALYYSVVDGDDDKRRYWVRWNGSRKDNIFVPQDVIDKACGPKPPVATKVTVTIVSLGPKRLPAHLQHPNAWSIDALPEGVNELRRSVRRQGNPAFATFYKAPSPPAAAPPAAATLGAGEALHENV